MIPNLYLIYAKKYMCRPIIQEFEYENDKPFFYARHWESHTLGENENVTTDQTFSRTARNH